MRTVELIGDHHRRQSSLLEDPSMPDVHRSGVIQPGGWRTIESGWNASFKVIVSQSPAGTQLKIRLGNGWPFGKDQQKQTSNGSDPMIADVRATIFYARVQVRVHTQIELLWTYIPIGPPEILRE